MKGEESWERNAFLTPLYFYAKIKLLIGFRGRAKLSISGAPGLGDTHQPLIWGPDFIGYIRVFTTLSSFDKNFISPGYL